MSKIKIIFYLILIFVVYKGFVAIKDFEVGVGDRVAEIKEHLFTESRYKCLELKKIAEESSNAYYECAQVNAVLKGKKIVSIINEIEVFN